MAIKLKRGTTESWTLGPELVDFGRSSTKGKDSVIRAEGTELEMYVYTTSANEWYVEDPAGSLNGGKTDGKIPGLPIDFGIKGDVYDKIYRLVVDFEGPEDCNLELLGWSGNLERPDYSDGPYVDSAYQSSGTLTGFVKWPAEKVGVVAPVPVKIRVSYREVGVYEELEEGQLGVEYTEDNNVRVKIGIPGVTKWNELPYIFGDIDAALDSILAIQEELIGTIIFTIHSYEFTAIKGMTWGEWVNSRYNSCGAVANDDTITLWDGLTLTNPDGENALLTETILDGCQYDAL